MVPIMICDIKKFNISWMNKELFGWSHFYESTCEGNSIQHNRDREAYRVWFKRDRSTHSTLLSSMHDNLIGEYENFLTAKKIWNQFKINFSATLTTNLRALNLKFETYKMDPCHKMTEYLRKIFGMIHGESSYKIII